MSFVILGGAAITAVGSIGAAAMSKQKAPGVAQPIPIDVGQAAGDAISANRNNFGAASDLATDTNNFNSNEARRLLEQAMPGFGAMQKRLMDSVNSDLSSENSMSPEMEDQIARFAAEKGVARGTSGGFNGFSLVKDFGFNMVDWKNAQRARALNTLSTVFGMAPRVNPMSPMAMFVDPNTAVSAQAQNSSAATSAAQAGLNASAAARNHNASMWGGVLQGAVGAIGGAVMDRAVSNGVQSKVYAPGSAQKNGDTMTPYVVNG